jgi:hypothetical protein
MFGLFGKKGNQPGQPAKPGAAGVKGALPTGDGKQPIGTVVMTGQTCPESGIWESQGTPSGRSSFTRGTRMPPFDKKSVVWKLVRYP